MKVVIIGSGNVATIFGKKILEAGNDIVQVVARNAAEGYSLSSLFNSEFTANLLAISLFADIYIISVADEAINEIVSVLRLNNKIVVHTAASVPQDALSLCSCNYGVLYPLQTLKKEIKIIPPIPILINANNEQTKQALITFASQWADSVCFTNDSDRLKLHLAAVFANNFTNHLLALSNSICSNNQLEFNLLLPIIKETIKRVQNYNAKDVQTGPAVRNDKVTIAKHQKMLENEPAFLKVYDVLTDSIINFYSKDKS